MQSGMRGRKMNVLYEWIRSLVSYMILMTVIMNLLPDKKYEKYLHLFTGTVFLLLVFRPLADMTGVEERIAGAFERITFQTDAKILQKEIEDADGTRMGQLVERYRAVLEQELFTMAEAVQAECEHVELVIETNLENAEFGALRNVKMRFRLEGSTAQERILVVNRQISELKTRIGAHYGVEERNIAVILETE